jgi:hypothetical protein
MLDYVNDIGVSGNLKWQPLPLRIEKNVDERSLRPMTCTRDLIRFKRLRYTLNLNALVACDLQA